MVEPVSARLHELLSETGLSDTDIDSLASQLVWRMGRLSDDAPLTIRVGLASNITLFADLPKLRSASEAEIETAIKESDIRIEWVGRMPA